MGWWALSRLPSSRPLPGVQDAGDQRRVEGGGDFVIRPVVTMTRAVCTPSDTESTANVWRRRYARCGTTSGCL
jgi:hypothetical protein